MISEKEKRIIEYHEVGHALVVAMQTHSAPVHKITIIPRTSGTLGCTMQGWTVMNNTFCQKRNYLIE